MRVAVVGAGIAGLGAAYALDGRHDVTLFEAQPRLGGHAHTKVITYDGAEIAVDTGFIVYNALNYPNLMALFADLGIEFVETDMSFAVSIRGGLEWGTDGLRAVFSNPWNIGNPIFLGMLGDVVAFCRAARRDLAEGRLAGLSLAQYCAQLRLGRRFTEGYLRPIGGAIWSTSEGDILEYPAESFLRFFNNHRLLLNGPRPRWRTVVGGSRTYVARLAERLNRKPQVGDAVRGVRRESDGREVTLEFASGRVERFDHVVLACHSDEALAVLATATTAERNALAAIRYAPNTAYLHRDPALMPRRRAAWSSWNIIRTGPLGGPVCVTYWMNRLQRLDPSRPLFVTLNPPQPPDPARTFAKIDYAHPQFDAAALAAQATIRNLSGRDRVSFAGAWLGYGFHEDGLASGLAAARQLGGAPPWDRDSEAFKAAA